MTQILVPSDELDAASSALSIVLDNIDISGGGEDLNAALGSPLIGAGNNFEKRWRDGREQLHRQCTEVKQQLDKVRDTFAEADRNAGESLGSGK